MTTAATITSTTAALSTITAAATTMPESQEMDYHLFQKFFHIDDASATATTASSTEPWLSPEFFSSQQSVHSTPEIATPQAMFLTSPSSPSFDKQPQQPGFEDLDVFALLDMGTPTTTPLPPVFQQQPQQSASEVPMFQQLSVGLCGDLPAALAALAAGSAVTHQQQQEPPSPAVTVMSSPSSSSPVIQELPTPPTTSAGQKRGRSSGEQSALSSSDEVAMKRQKNTDAARRSRLRKVLKMEALESRVAELERANTTLLLRAAVLESEKSTLLTKEASYEQRIKTLEAQLCEAHQSLAGIARGK